MSFPRYPTYKDCGVKWLGSVPEHWRVGAIKYFVLPKNGSIKTGPFGSHLTSAEMQDGTVKVYNQRNVIDGDFEFGENFISEEKFAELASFETFPGDLLITTRGTIGRTAILPQNADRGVLHPCLLRIQPNTAKIDTRFLRTLIQDSDVMKTQLSYLSNATTIEVIYSNTIASVLIPVPPVNEQVEILDFLDRETAKVDELVAEQRRLIELLKEKRQAVISHAVTKGLNSSAPTKPSGIEWLGDVPEHWTVTKLGRAAFMQEGPGLRNWQFTDEGTRVICVTNITENGIDFSRLEKFISRDEYNSSYRHFTVQTGDVLLSSSGNSWGKVAIYEGDEKVILNTSTIRLNELDGSPLIRDFLAILLQSSTIREQLGLAMTGSCQPNFGPTHLNSVIVAVPWRLEQSEIAAFVASETVRLDALTTEALRGIDLLQERRTALISAAVTGKIDVRGLATKVVV